MCYGSHCLFHYGNLANTCTKDMKFSIKFMQYRFTLTLSFDLGTNYGVLRRSKLILLLIFVKRTTGLQLSSHKKLRQGSLVKELQTWSQSELIISDILNTKKPQKLLSGTQQNKYDPSGKRTVYITVMKSHFQTDLHVQLCYKSPMFCRGFLRRS